MPGSNVSLSVKFLRESARAHPPTRATPGSAGLDLRAALDVPSLTIAPGQRVAVPTGIAIEIGKPGLAGFIFSRSGLGARDGLTVAHGVGVIDPDYRGELVVWLLNTADEPRTIQNNERIAQLVILHVFAPVIQVVEDLSDTSRGQGGFGHSGKV